MVHKQQKTTDEKTGLFQRVAIFFFTHIKTTAILWAIVVILGVLVYGWFMKREGFPSVQVPVGIVQVGYPLKSAAEVDSEAVKPIDEAIRKSSLVESVTATSRDNFGVLVVRFKEDTGTSKEGLDAVRATVDSLQLPEAAQVEYQEIDAAKFDNKYEAIIAVYSDTISDPRQLYDLAINIAARANEGDIALGDGYRAEVITQYVEGSAPDGTALSIQRSADRIGRSIDNSAAFYNSVSIGIIAPEKFDIFELQKKLEAFTAAGKTDQAQLLISATFAPDITSQINNLQTSLFEGLIIILVISLVLIHFRAGIVTGLSMITVLLLTLIVLWAAGFTLNTITLFALILCLGLIVDDTTIVAEAIDKESTRTSDKKQIISQAVRRVALASTAGTVTTMLGFAPLLFIGGVLGDFIRIMPITIITSLAMSLLVSLSLVPFLSRWSIREKGKLSIASRVLQRFIAHPLAVLLRFMRYGRLNKVAFSLLTISLSIVALGVAGFYFQKLKFDIFPSTKDSNSLSVAVRYQGVTNLPEALSRVESVEKILQSEVGSNIASVAYYNQISTTSAQMSVRLIPYKDRDVTAPQLVERIHKAALENLSNVSVSASQNDAGPPKESLPFRIQILTEDQSKSDAAVNALVPLLNQTVLERPNGTTAKIINAQPADSSSIVREDGKRIAEIRAGFDAEDTSTLVTVAKDFVTSQLTPERLSPIGLTADNFTFNFGNEEENQESFRSMIIAFPILLIAMLVLLAVQFRSFIQPLLIFLAVPFSLLGVAIGLYATNNPLSFFVMIGLFALIGISVNNTILLTDYANQGLREGKGYTDAIADALEQRLRPLLITSLTAVVALIPLALSDPFWEPLCVTLIFGLIASTLLVITIFPYYYLMVERVRLGIYRSWRKIRRNER